MMLQYLASILVAIIDFACLEKLGMLQNSSNVDLLSFLPNELLVDILALLTGNELAVLSVQSTHMRMTIRSFQLWKHACKKKWEFLPVEAYFGDWNSLYTERMILSESLWDYFESSSILRSYWEGQSSNVSSDGYSSVEIFEQVMRIVFHAGQTCHMDANVSNSKAYKRLLGEDCKWWIKNHSHLFLTFIVSTMDRVFSFDEVAGGYVHRPSVPWRRTAIHYMLDFFTDDERVESLQMITKALQRLDDSILKAMSQNGKFCEDWGFEFLSKKGKDWCLVFKSNLNSRWLKPCLHEHILDVSKCKIKSQSH